jgi:hypothetical protein
LPLRPARASLRVISSTWSTPTPRARQMWATCSHRSCAACLQ